VKAKVVKFLFLYTIGGPPSDVLGGHLHDHEWRRSVPYLTLLAITELHSLSYHTTSHAHRDV